LPSLYKFRVSLEDDENIYRDIEIQSTQLIKDFFPCVYHSFGQKKSSSASLYKSNEGWDKGKQFTDLGIKMSSVVETPHQKMIFELHHSLFGDYLIELIRLSSEYDNTIHYPRCTKSRGLLPNPISDEDEQEFSELALDEEDDLEGLTEYDAENT